MKEWKPQREFKKADFPANPGERKQEKRPSAEKAAPLEPEITTDVKPGRVVKAWMPPSVAEPSQTKKVNSPAFSEGAGIERSASATGPADARPSEKTRSPERQSIPSQTSAQPPRSTPKLFAPESREQAARRAAEEADTKRAAADMSGEMLDELVIARPIEATDLLRRWYWQKPEGGTTPQTKIYIILHSMKKETLVELYRCFTAMERRQMHEIFSKKRTVVKSEILSARGEFMQRLSQTFT
ncbi:hypothetical protein [Leptonema illini]|uniref:Uncharacterized protein n=1 Tax=Leptonema illini DSM 21528 TaxID=929563 RepID=H2CHP7_9LEPT|nr:hypothetical protein [Leptonema illini]EHQ05892.1 hypothetical protein Lepil_1198 [Leptonema illini DSM 21528]